MIEYDRKNWVKSVFSLRGTALRRAGKRVIFFILYACIVQAAYDTVINYRQKPFLFNLSPTEHAVLGSLLGFLIVFRMNASNNRYWEGHRAGGKSSMPAATWCASASRIPTMAASWRIWCLVT